MQIGIDPGLSVLPVCLIKFLLEKGVSSGNSSSFHLEAVNASRNASEHSFLLPYGVNERLSKGSALVNINSTL